MDGMSVMHDGWITTLDSLEGSGFSTGAQVGREKNDGTLMSFIRDVQGQESSWKAREEES